MTYLIVIPARGGSKGIPGKNIIDIGGKPLVAYSIAVANEALTAGVNGEAIVSTDSGDIAKVAREWGGNVPFMRPDDISGDSSKSVDFLIHALDFYERQSKGFDAAIILQPTSPLRTAEDVLQAVSIYESAGQPSLITAYREDYICDLVCYRRRGDIAQPLNTSHNAGITRQQHGELYVRNGSVYITDVKYLQREKKVICDTPAMYVMPKNRSINLDTEDDLELLNWYLRQA